MMDCRQVQPKLADHSVGMLPPREAEQMEAHLTTCAGCAREWRELQAVMGMVERLGSREPPPHLWNGVYNRITAEPRREHAGLWERWLRRPRWLITSAATGAAAAALVTALLFTRPTSVEPGLGTFPVTGQSVVTIQQHARVSEMEPFADEVGLEAYGLLVDDPEIN